MMRSVILTSVVIGAAFAVSAAPAWDVIPGAKEINHIASAAGFAACGLLGMALMRGERS